MHSTKPTYRFRLVSMLAVWSMISSLHAVNVPMRATVGASAPSVQAPSAGVNVPVAFPYAVAPAAQVATVKSREIGKLGGGVTVPPIRTMNTGSSFSARMLQQSTQALRSLGGGMTQGATYGMRGGRVVSTRFAQGGAVSFPSLTGLRALKKGTYVSADAFLQGQSQSSHQNTGATSTAPESLQGTELIDEEAIGGAVPLPDGLFVMLLFAFGYAYYRVRRKSRATL